MYHNKKTVFSKGFSTQVFIIDWLANIVLPITKKFPLPISKFVPYSSKYRVSKWWVCWQWIFLDDMRRSRCLFLGESESWNWVLVCWSRMGS